MYDWKDEHAVVAALTSWLETTRSEVESIGDDADSAALPSPDEMAASWRDGKVDFIEQLTSMRHEINLATKAMRSGEERGEAAILAMQAAIDELHKTQAAHDDTDRDVAAPLVTSLIELDESLRRTSIAVGVARHRYVEASHRQIDAFMERLDGLYRTQSWWRRKLCGPWYRAVRFGELQDLRPDALALFDALAEGVELIQRRLQRALDEHEIVRMACVGRAVDPEAMTVLEVVSDASLPPNTVCAELRAGYYWHGAPFRFAEVKAVGRTGQ